MHSANANKSDNNSIFEQINEAERQRIQITLQCKDADVIPKVQHAGQVYSEGEDKIQIMHNGVKIIEGGYCGAWMTEIIKNLKGHHEPQEEYVYYQILQRIKSEVEAPTILELGSYWAYYSLWCINEMPSTQAYLIEPDPHFLEIGKKNFLLNDAKGNFIHAAIGQHAISAAPFFCVSDNQERTVPYETLPTLFKKFNLSHLDILLADIQGAETTLLENAKELLKTQRVRFLILSTHHHTISNDPLTHQICLNRIKEYGGHIIAEHSVMESYSGDGLIVASFNPKDSDFTVNISYNRSSNNIFPAIENDLAVAQQKEISLTHELNLKTQQLNDAHVNLSVLKEEISNIIHSKSWRYTQPFRHLLSIVK